MPRRSNVQKPYAPQVRREAVALDRGSGRSPGSRGDCFDDTVAESVAAALDKRAAPPPLRPDPSSSAMTVDHTGAFLEPGRAAPNARLPANTGGEQVSWKTP